ncbi:NADP oxidoreductase, partial [Candidatus Cryosericum odellii]
MKLFSTQIIVPVDSNSVLQGALEVKHVLEETIGKYNLGSQISVVETGALGIYDQGVVLAVFPDDVYYGGVKPTDVEEIVTEHLLKGRVVSRLTIDRSLSSKRLVEKESGKSQQKIVLRNAGLIDPQSIDEYIARDGYGALAKALAMQPGEVIQVLT